MSTISINTQCPFCNHHVTISRQRYSDAPHFFDHGNRHGPQYVRTEVMVCPNEECKEYWLLAHVGPGKTVMQPGGAPGTIALPSTRTWRLVPDSCAKVLPDYIPAPIVADYREACLIRDLSPKASATLARRCLQGMIRDFWHVSGRRLVDEIESIKDRVDPTTWTAIDAVRKVGNIGAHMEHDINVVIDVEPDEAQLLIELIEMLIHDWYVNRHEREVRMQRVKELAEEKK